MVRLACNLSTQEAGRSLQVEANLVSVGNSRPTGYKARLNKIKQKKFKNVCGEWKLNKACSFYSSHSIFKMEDIRERRHKKGVRWLMMPQG